MNAMEDRETADRLYAASRAGVKVTLIVRGFCCLRPGIEGLSENIRVLSVIGRFLEHARIFHFGAGREELLDGDWYIASADWMYRNLSNRVEVAVPVRDAVAKARLAEIISTHLADHCQAWELEPDGEYRRRTIPEGTPEDSPVALGTFETLIRAAAAEA
jgi:polyphosphate kinase